MLRIEEKKSKEVKLKVFTSNTRVLLFLCNKNGISFLLQCCQLPFIFHCVTLAIWLNKKGIPNSYQILDSDKLFAKAITEQDQILCSMVCIPAHARVAG